MFQNSLHAIATIVYNMGMAVTSFTRKLNALLESRGWSQAQLALRSKLSRGYIGLLLSGERESPSLDIAARIARAFGVSLDWLADMPAHEVDQMPADEQELISSYRAITDAKARRMALLSVTTLADLEVPEGKDKSSKG